MNWEAVGAVGEILAAVAVVVSLVYLAVQVKSNTEHLDRTIQATRIQTRQSWVENYNAWRQMVLESANSDVWIRGLNDLSDLSRNEKIKFNKIAGSVIWSTWYMYYSVRSEGVVPSANDRVYREIFMHPGLNEFMKFQRLTHADEFGDFLDEVRESVGSERLRPGQPSSFTEGIY